MENAIVIENREEPILLPSEAATLEHMLMCEYLFVAFSLKTGPDQGLPAPRSKTVARWERTVSAVAV